MHTSPIDRVLQKSILDRLAACYPERDPELISEGTAEEKKQIANLLYLQEHQLVDAGLKQVLSGDYGYFGAKITARGLDFLQDDGGLTAILGTVTVRLHEDSIRAMLSAKIDTTSLPTEQKNTLKKQISSLSSEALKVATKKLVEKGIDAIPDAATWLQGVIHSVA